MPPSRNVTAYKVTTPFKTSLNSDLPAHILIIMKLIKTYVHILTNTFMSSGNITAMIDQSAPKVAESRIRINVAAYLQTRLTNKSTRKSITRFMTNKTSIYITIDLSPPDICIIGFRGCEFCHIGVCLEFFLRKICRKVREVGDVSPYLKQRLNASLTLA